MTTPQRQPGATAAAPARVALLLALVCVLALPAGCSTARRRHDPVGPLSLLRFRDAQTYEYFHDTYRTGNLYLDFRPALVVDAIVEDATYRRLYVKMLGEQYLLPQGEVERLRAEQRERFRNHVDILLFVYEGTNRESRLHREDALWRVFLRDDDGQLTSPEAIRRIGDDSQVFAYLDKYFYGLDRWSQAYRVSFPKLSKAVLGQPVGPEPFELIVTGVKGTVTLQWEDPTLFYEPGALAARPASSSSQYVSH